MRVLVCGGRHFDEWKTLAKALDALEVTVLMQGGAGGADQMALKWAETRGIPVITFPANWRSGKRGGPERNAFMLAEGKPHMVVAFPGGAGTADMVRKAKAAGVKVIEHNSVSATPST
jgi:predicted Rossmann-fold nucleotide-binding protein